MDSFDDREIYEGNEKRTGRRRKSSSRRNKKSDTDDEEESESYEMSDALRSDEIGIRLERLLKEQAELKEKAQ